jgi:hypothetical protein
MSDAEHNTIVFGPLNPWGVTDMLEMFQVYDPEVNHDHWSWNISTGWTRLAARVKIARKVYNTPGLITDKHAASRGPLTFTEVR